MKRILSLPHFSVSFLTVALALAAFFAGGSLFAQDNDSLFRRADSLYVAGIDLYNDEDYLAAAELFERCDSLNKAVGREMPFYSNNAYHWAARSYIEAGDTVRAKEVDAKYYMLPPDDRRLTVKADSLYLIAGQYANRGDWKNAVAYGEQAMEEYGRELGKGHRYCAMALANVGWCHYYAGEPDKAVECMDAAVDILISDNSGNPDIYYWLDKIMDIYSEAGDYAMAAEYGARSVGFKREILGEDNGEFALSLFNMSLYYSESGDYQTSIDAGLRVLDILGNIGGKSDQTYASALSNLAEDYSCIGNYERAVEFGEAAAKTWKGIVGGRHQYYALSLYNLAMYYSSLGDYGKAIESGTEAMEIWKLFSDGRNQLYASSLTSLSNFYENLGNYETALEFGAEGMEMMREILGERHPDYLMSLSNMSVIYSNLGDYGKALELGTKALETWGEILEEQDPDQTTLLNYAMLLNNLARCYEALGIYDKALVFGTEVMEIRREALGERHSDYAAALNNMAAFYDDIGDCEKAVEFGTEAIEIMRDTLGERDPGYTAALGNLANYYAGLGDYEKAVELGTKAVEIEREVHGDRNLGYASSLSNLASYYNNGFDNFEKAVELGTEAMEIRKEVLGDRHPDYALSLNNLAVFYSGLGNFEKAFENRRLSNVMYAGILRDNFGFMTADERSMYWDGVKGRIAAGAKFCLAYPSGAANVLAYDMELLGKGILLSSEREFDKIIKESGDEGLLAEFEQLRQDRLQLEVYYKRSVADRPADEVARLEAEAEQMEKDLIAGSKEYGDFTRSLAIEWGDVQDALLDNDVAVEFAKVEFASESHYVALVLRNGWEAPRCSYLGTAESFEPYLAMNYNNLYKSREFSEKVWAGIIEVADLQEGDNVYFSPDGIFYQLGIEYLPVVGEDGEVQSDGSAGRIMADKYNLRRLSSTKGLCFEPSAVAESSAVLYGGLIYEADTEGADGGSDGIQVADNDAVSGAAAGDEAELADIAGVDGETGTQETVDERGEFGRSAAGAGEEETKRDLTVGRLLAERGERSAEADSLMRDNIKYLPGTLAEADTLAIMLADRNIAYEKYTGYRGTEESFKALTGNAPKLIHIATHGFYLSPTSAELMSQQRHNDFLSLGEDRQNNVIDYSMSRSGLLFSGSQPAWLGEPVPAGEDDGILTAQEIAGLDLRGVDMAVLSACSTANGEVTGDGVAGLQRGFKKAGVKTLLLTLWEVNDRATQLFMTKFYENLTSGKSKRQSFTLAQRYLRDYEDWIELEIDDPDGEPVYDDTIGDYVRPTKTVRELGRPYSAPQYWAAFIMLD